MHFRELEKNFKEDVTKQDLVDGATGDGLYRYWLLRLLFEIAGNLDSMVVSYRELVKLHKERQK